MATPNKSAGTSHSSGSEAETGKIATLRGGFCASETEPRSRNDVLDDIDRRLAQLYALLNSIYGGGFESFSSLNGELQDSILWLASDLVRDVRADVSALSNLVAAND